MSGLFFFLHNLDDNSLIAQDYIYDKESVKLSCSLDLFCFNCVVRNKSKFSLFIQPRMKEKKQRETIINIKKV